MATYDNRNSGALFKNEKNGNDRAPDYRGQLNVDGVDYWVSGWIKTAGPNARNPGSKFMSLAVTPEEDQESYKPRSDFDDGDIPF